MGLVDDLEQAGADYVAQLEDVIGGVIYKVHEYVAPLVVGGDGHFYRCSWRTPQVLAWLQERSVDRVVNLCHERSDLEAVEAVGMTSIQLPIEDGSVPTPNQASRFLIMADLVLSDKNGRMGFGCEAGVGRTGCMAALLLVRRYYWSPAKALEDAHRYGMLMPRQIEWIGSL